MCGRHYDANECHCRANYITVAEGKSGVIGKSDVASVALAMQVAPITLAAGGREASSQTYTFQVYVGPKDKSLFEQNPLYQQLGYIHTIEFGACCSMGFIDTMSFAILSLMKWAYQYIPNYGVVIIILVLLVRSGAASGHQEQSDFDDEDGQDGAAG